MHSTSRLTCSYDMPNRGKIPNKARLKYAAEKAYQLLIDMGFDWFPISPFDIIKQYPKRITCLSWSDARTILHSKDLFHLHQLGAEARTIHVRNQDLYMIVYDEVDMTNPDRILWTIMHELGHIVLGHLIDFEATALSRGGLSRTEYSVLEIEAHRFAAEMFAPAAFFRSLSYIGSKELRLICGISEEAANKQYNYMQTLQYAPPTKYDGKLEHNFLGNVYKRYGELLYDGIRRVWGRPGYKKYVALSRKCPHCYAFNTLPEAKYCIFCGEELEPNYNGRSVRDIEAERTRIAGMRGRNPSIVYVRRNKHDHGKYPEYQLFCPRCLNDDITPETKYCRICGQPLHNTCRKEHKRLPAAARFCPDCGSPAAYQEMYATAESRLDSLAKYKDNEKWIEYPYWEYVKLTAAQGDDRTLASVLFYSKAFVDDDNNLLILVTNASVARIIKQLNDAIFDIVDKYDAQQHPVMGVYSINAL